MWKFCRAARASPAPLQGTTSAPRSFSLNERQESRLYSGSRRPRAQSEERRPRHSARCAGRLHRRLRLGQIVARLRHALRRGAAALSRIGRRRMRGACSTRWRCRTSIAIDGLPPAVALQQQRGSPTTRSSVGSVTTLSNLLRMLYSRAGDYPREPDAALRRVLLAEHARRRLPALPRSGPRLRGDRAHRWCPTTRCTIRERAIAAWPPAWHGQNLRDILITARLRRRPAVARPAAEGSRLDALHRRTAGRAGLCRVHVG